MWRGSCALASSLLDIIASILAYRQPAELIVDRLRGPIPFDWNEQRRLFGFDVAERAR